MSGYFTKKRDLVLRDDAYHEYNGRLGGATAWDLRGRCRVFGKQITASEGHPWNEFSSYKGQDVGGPFRTEKKYIEENRSDPGAENPLYDFQYTNSNGVTWIYQGPVYPVTPHDVAAAPFPTSIESSDATLDAWGTKAIALCKPTNSVANLAVGTAELIREGIPKMAGHALWQTRLRDIRATGNEYLNIVFGWQPLVSEILDAAKAMSNSEKILAQYERDAGRVVRRQYEFPSEKTITVFPDIQPKGDPWIPAVHTPLGQYSPYTVTPVTGQGRITKVRTTEVSRKFSGAFSYYLPTGYDSRSKIQRAALLADKLYGISLTPEVLWNLTPWSWATDWFFNMGDVMSNVSDYLVDGLVLRYGYIMETTIVKDTYTCHDLPFKRYGKTTIAFSKITQVKKRRPATPFGFGLTYDGLSTKQKAIMAAIGITRF